MARKLAMALFVFLGMATIANASCPDGQQEVCSYNNQEVCGYHFENVCHDVQVCDPMDSSNCHTESQCAYENVYRCENTMVYSCVCGPATPGPDATDFCQSYGCTDCSDNKQFCGSYNSCTKQWVNGDWRFCTPSVK